MSLDPNIKECDFLKDYVQVADIHADRLQIALVKMELLLPLTADNLSKLTETQLAFFDMLTTRFSKLQDIIGSKIFSLILEILGEDALAFIDKLNKLEKLGYLDNANWWMELREIRNKITHDYPNDYDVIALHAGSLLAKAAELLVFWNNLKQKIDLLYGKIKLN